jgi:retron-type reverse transcriptase
MADEAPHKQSDFAALKSAQHVAIFLSVNWRALRHCLYRMPPSERYRSFEIPKRGGGSRVIDAPTGTIKAMQVTLLRQIEQVYTPRAPVHAFTFHRSIVTNARRHVGCRWLLNVDLQDFFPTIHLGRVIGIFKAWPFECGHEAATVLAQLCTFNARLPQGAPTSPIISNMICFKMDRDILSLAKTHRCVYTRYADDISISTRQEQISTAFVGAADSAGVFLGTEFRSIISAAGFQINPSKIRLQHRSNRLVVTGLKINRFPNVRRSLISQIRAMLHAWEKFGLSAAHYEFSQKYDRPTYGPRLSPRAFRFVLLGKLLFLGQVRGFFDKRFTEFAAQLYELDPTLLPKSPRYAVSQVARAATCVLTDDDESQTGSGFFLAGVGLITCHHVAKWATRAFYPDKLSDVYSVQREESKEDFDLAICQTDLPARYELRPRFAELRTGAGVFSHGFPDYTPGFKGQFQQGRIVAKRRKFGHTRYIVSMRIVGGNSGGPLLSAYGEAVGVAVTGDVRQDTGYVPIEYAAIPIYYLRTFEVMRTRAPFGET